MTNEINDILGEFRLGRRLTSTSQIVAIGMAIFIGLILLLSEQVTQWVGLRAPVAGLLVIVLLGLTLLSVVELLGGSGEHGGTYVLVEEALGGLPAFLTGWGILAGCLTLWAALTRSAAIHIVGLLDIEFPPLYIALALVAGSLLLQLFQFLPRRIQVGSLVTLVLTVLFVTLISDLPQANLQFRRTTPPVDTTIISQSIAWLSVSYIVFETILSVRREVQDPSRYQPVAILTTLIIGGLLLIATLFISARLASVQPSEMQLVIQLAENSFLPAWLVRGMAIIALLAAGNGCFITAARQFNNLSREGGLPRTFRRARPPFQLPPIPFVALTLLVVPLLVWLSLEWLIHSAGGIFLSVMVMLNIAAVHSHRTEPDRRRLFTVPFAPLIPAIAILINLAMLRFIPLPAISSVVLWSLAGAAYYFAYARTHQREAQAGDIVFGREMDRKTKKHPHRILVPIGPGEERHFLLQMATGIAHQLNGEVIPLQVVHVPDPLAIEEGRRTAKERNTLFRWSVRAATDAGVSVFPITRLARSIPEGIRDTAIEEDCDLILMPWAIKDDFQGPRIGSILGQVAREAPCDVAVVSYRPEQARIALMQSETADETSAEDTSTSDGRKIRIDRILVPTSGGPNAPLATRLALLWAREYEATVSSIYITVPNATEEDITTGEGRIQTTIETMREHAKEFSRTNEYEIDLSAIPIEGEVVSAVNVVQGIAEAGAEFDLVLLGASEESLIDQVLFGNIPEQVARSCPKPVIIVRRYRGLPRLWLTRLWNTIYQALPTLTDEEQIEVYRTIHRGARPDVDFFIMISLATLIATYGLFLNSSAVIIGAMLVAPLFSPLIALSLSIAQGNVRLFRVAVEANIKGMALAIGLAFFLGFISPDLPLSPEIFARTQPSIQDLIVALASGAAGAYAMARKDVAASLPGVAIAAALVPPLGVVGIGLAAGDLEVASGSSLLFVANLVAIVLAGSVVFLLLGFRPGGHGTREVHLRRGLVVTILLFFLVTIPLVTVFVGSLQRTRLEITIQEVVVQHLNTYPAIELVDLDLVTIDDQNGVLVVTIPLYTRAEIAEDLATELDRVLSGAIDRSVHTRLVTQTLIETPP